jgi:transcriptional regulator with XRE-family HTH domain
MARSRPGLQKAINDILIGHGVGGKPLSLRQAERLTGLSPATIGELAKGNARTPETLRRFARGFGESAERLLLLGGFSEAIDHKEDASSERANPTRMVQELNDDLQPWLERYSAVLQALPPGRTRSLLLARLRCDTELLESLLTGDTQNIHSKGDSAIIADLTVTPKPADEAHEVI